MFRAILVTILFCCGTPTHALEAKPKIVGGYQADQYLSYAIPQGSALCGATVIHEDILLTAAHCQGAFLSGVLIGATTADGQDAQEVLAVDKEFLHPNYTPGPELNDIMLVKLSSPSSAPLQPLNFDPSLPTDGATLTVIGFGNTQTGGVSSFNLLEVQTQAVSFVACSTNYTAASLQVVDEIMFCDKADAKGSCQGDSGGPLFVGPKGDQVQVGLVSWGLECASPTFPGVNTRISAYQDWITQGICDLSANPPTSCTRSTNSTSPPSPSSSPANQTSPDSPSPVSPPVITPTTMLPGPSSPTPDSPRPSPPSGPGTMLPLPLDPAPSTAMPSPPNVASNQTDASPSRSSKDKGQNKSSKSQRDPFADGSFAPTPSYNSTDDQDDFSNGSSKSAKGSQSRSSRSPKFSDADASFAPTPFYNDTDSFSDVSSKSPKGSRGRSAHSSKGPSIAATPVPSSMGNNTSTQQTKLGQDNYINGMARNNDGPFCSDGVLSSSGRVCCGSLCDGRCGGRGCGGLRGRSLGCCTKAIRRAGKFCTTSTDTACLIPWQRQS